MAESTESLKARIEELQKEIAKLKKSIKKKKYGLVWMDVPEAFENDVENKLPILKEDPDRAVVNEDDKPTHILIEGDNYHALTCLNYTHKGKVDIIYIDPPYNTGTDKFKYRDKRIISEFPDGSEVKKDHPFRHSYWLSFIYKRIHLCKGLLSRDGVIFISIDDNEYAQMKLLMDEVFGETNYVASLVWEKKKKGSHLNDFVTNVKEYVLVYCKDTRYFEGLVAQVTSHRETYPCVNPGNTRDIRKIPAGIKSNYREKDFHLPSGSIISSGNMELKLISDLTINNGILANELIIEGEWRYTQDNMTELASNGSLYLTRDLYLRRIVEEPRGKKLKDLLPRVDYNFLIELKDNLILEYEKEIRDEKAIDKIKSAVQNVESGIHVTYDPSNLYVGGWGSNEDADVEQRDLFGEKVFDYPKPLQLRTSLLAQEQQPMRF
jgi:adenine specific DNA methylase Mod